MKGEQEDEQDGDEANGEDEKTDGRVEEADDDAERQRWRLELVPRRIGVLKFREIGRIR